MDNAITFNEYYDHSKAHDVTKLEDEIYLGIIGVGGEGGDLVSALKKELRDEAKYYHLNDTIEEEIGDCLWYVFKISRGKNINPAETLGLKGNNRLSKVDISSLKRFSEKSLSIHLIKISGNLASKIDQPQEVFLSELANAITCLAAIAAKYGKSLCDIASTNNIKTNDRYAIPKLDSLKRYDEDFPRYERLPSTIEVVFSEVTEGKKKKSLMYINELRLGSPLTDNSKSYDDYRFHDVFHFAYFAILGWSPVIRALLKLKRKSDSTVDEVDDGARAILVEEGISHLVFKYAERNNFLRDDKRVDTALLKTIKAMVDGLEVSERPLSLWEKAIQDGFKVFRLLKKHRRGRIIINMDATSITFAKISDR